MVPWVAEASHAHDLSRVSSRGGYLSKGMVAFSDLEVSVRGATAEASASQRAALDRDGYAIVSAVVQHHELDAIWRYRAEPTLREHGVLTDNPTSWDTGSPLWALLDERKAYRNREGAQLQTASTEHFDVLDRAPELERSLGDGLPKWVARANVSNGFTCATRLV